MRACVVACAVVRRGISVNIYDKHGMRACVVPWLEGEYEGVCCGLCRG